MTRQSILQSYNVKDGLIVSPGQFEGEPIFAPYFWEIAMNGFADFDDGKVFRFTLKKGDESFALFPELKPWLGRKRTLELYQSDQGFIYCR